MQYSFLVLLLMFIEIGSGYLFNAHRMPTLFRSSLSKKPFHAPKHFTQTQLRSAVLAGRISPRMSGQEISEAKDESITEDVSRQNLKGELLRAVGLCDRGFVATDVERDRISKLIADLSTLTPTSDPTFGVDGDVEIAPDPTMGVDSDEKPYVPLKGCWRLAYTSALDVLSLAASPLASVGAIYQDARRLPEIINVIDQSPRLLSQLPATAKLQSTLRLKVTTRKRRPQYYIVHACTRARSRTRAPPPPPYLVATTTARAP